MSDYGQEVSDFYVVGGAMKPSAPSYIERKADKELYEHILKGDFCYVLTPRQTGKSSLMARTKYKLNKRNIQTAVIELNQFKEKTDADKWYHAIAEEIVKELKIEIEFKHWWKEQSDLPALRRLTKFFIDVLLPNIDEPIVIFLDEIDSTINLPFTDDFFAAIRACYNLRATHPEYERLTFVLLGVAKPSQLIKDVRRTPFNIGHQIDLNDFTSEEAEPLSMGLSLYDSQREKALIRIYYWTKGHPYLTQKLCQIVASERSGANIDDDIDRLVKEHFLAPGANRDETNLKFVFDQMLQAKEQSTKGLKLYQQRNKKDSRTLLKLYQRIYRGKTVIYEPRSPIHQSLKLIGIVVPGADRKLSIRNRIYEQAFSKDWLKKYMPVDWKRNISIVFGLVILVSIIWNIYFASGLIKTINSAQDKPPIPAYETLRKLPGYAGKAAGLMADYWERRARQAENRGKRDHALLYYLKALTVKATDDRWHELGKVDDDYSNLINTYQYRNSILAITFRLNNEQYVLTKYDRGIARLWSTVTGNFVKAMKHGNPINCATFSPNGQKVLTGSSDGTIKLWYVHKREPSIKHMEHENWVNSVAFSPDGKIVLSGSSDGTARLWQADTGESLGKPLKHSFPVNCAVFSPDGKTILTGSLDGTVRLWQANTGEPLEMTVKHNDAISTAAFSPDGTTVLTGCKDGTATLWQVGTDETLEIHLKHDASVSAAAFSPDGKTVLTGSSDGVAQLWKTDTGKSLGIPMKHYYSINSVAFSPDGKTVLTGSSDGVVRLWYLAESLAASDSLNPEELLKQWQTKLSLQLNEETGEIEPIYPPEPKDDNQ